MIPTTRKRLAALLLTAVALLSVPATAPATALASQKLRVGVYDCMSYDFATGLLDYRESVKLIGGGRYQQAYGRHHAKMIKPTNGTYRINGSRLVFHGGALRNTPGSIHWKGSGFPFFALLLHGKPSGSSCYYVPKP